MRNQSRYLLLYLCVLGVSVGMTTQLAQAQDANQSQQQGQNEASNETIDSVQLNQAELDQMLAPIALYPDTLLPHILVASTYPLEVVQAARWRANNKDMDAKQALDAVENKNWDPSVKALVPFNDLLQKFSQDLDWLQGLGDAFLLNEEQVLISVQNLRKKAYAQGSLGNNDYVEVSQDNGQIVIENVTKEVVYVPYYDTRVVYGNWWWGAYPPYYWHSPSHYVWSGGFYWSPSFYIYPSFYFGGFHWHNHHVVANYHYRNNSHNYPHGRRVVNVREYPRWSHNPEHRRGVRYDHQQNPNRFVNSGQYQDSKKFNQSNKQRVLNTEKLNNKGQLSKQNVVLNRKNSDHQQASNEGIKRRLQDNQKVTSVRNESHTKNDRKNVNDRQRVIKAENSDQHRKVPNENKPVRQVNPQNSGSNSPRLVEKSSAPEIQQNNEGNERTSKYSSNRNQDSKSSVQRNSQRNSSSNKHQSRQTRQSKSSHREKNL